MPYNPVDDTFTVASLGDDGSAHLVGELDGLKMFDLGAGMNLFVGGIASLSPDSALHHSPLDFSIFYRHDQRDQPVNRNPGTSIDIAAAQKAAYTDLEVNHVFGFSAAEGGPLNRCHVGSLIDAVVALLKLVPVESDSFGPGVKLVSARPRNNDPESGEMIVAHILDLLSIPDVHDAERALVFLSDDVLKRFLSPAQMLSIHRRNRVIEHLDRQDISSGGFGYLPFGSFLSPMFEVFGRTAHFDSQHLKSSGELYEVFFDKAKMIADMKVIPGIEPSQSADLNYSGTSLVNQAKAMAVLVLGQYLVNPSSETYQYPPVEFFVNSKVAGMSAAQLYSLIDLFPFGTTEKSFNHIVDNMLKGKLTGDDGSEGYGFLADAEFVKIMSMLSTLAERNGKLDEDDENFLMDDFHENQPTILALLHGLLAAPREAGIEALDMVTSSKIDAMKERKQYAIDVAHLLEEYANVATDIPFTWYAKLGGLE